MGEILFCALKINESFIISFTVKYKLMSFYVIFHTNPIKKHVYFKISCLNIISIYKAKNVKK